MYKTKRQACTYNVTMGRVCATNVAVNSTIYCISRMCVRILVSATRHANRIVGASYYIAIYDLSGSTTFFHCCRGKVISITYSECVFVALVTQHAKRTRRIILYLGLFDSTIFAYIISKCTIFATKKKLLNLKCGF